MTDETTLELPIPVQDALAELRFDPEEDSAYLKAAKRARREPEKKNRAYLEDTSGDSQHWEFPVPEPKRALWPKRQVRPWEQGKIAPLPKSESTLNTVYFPLTWQTIKGALVDYHELMTYANTLMIMMNERDSRISIDSGLRRQVETAAGWVQLSYHHFIQLAKEHVRPHDANKAAPPIALNAEKWAELSGAFNRLASDMSGFGRMLDLIPDAAHHETPGREAFIDPADRNLFELNKGPFSETHYKDHPGQPEKIQTRFQKEFEKKSLPEPDAAEIQKEIGLLIAPGGEIHALFVEVHPPELRQSELMFDGALDGFSQVKLDLEKLLLDLTAPRSASSQPHLDPELFDAPLDKAMSYFMCRRWRQGKAHDDRKARRLASCLGLQIDITEGAFLLKYRCPGHVHELAKDRLMVAKGRELFATDPIHQGNYLNHIAAVQADLEREQRAIIELKKQIVYRAKNEYWDQARVSALGLGAVAGGTAVSLGELLPALIPFLVSSATADVPQIANPAVREIGNTGHDLIRPVIETVQQIIQVAKDLPSSFTPRTDSVPTNEPQLPAGSPLRPEINIDWIRMIEGIPLVYTAHAARQRLKELMVQLSDDHAGDTSIDPADAVTHDDQTEIDEINTTLIHLKALLRKAQWAAQSGIERLNAGSKAFQSRIAEMTSWMAQFELGLAIASLRAKKGESPEARKKRIVAVIAKIKPLLIQLQKENPDGDWGEVFAAIEAKAKQLLEPPDLDSTPAAPDQTSDDV